MDRTPTKLNRQQMEMLRLLDKPLPENEYALLKKTVVQILAGQLDEEMEKLENEKGWTLKLIANGEKNITELHPNDCCHRHKRTTSGDR